MSAEGKGSQSGGGDKKPTFRAGIIRNNKFKKKQFQGGKAKSASAIIPAESNFKGDTEDINGFLSLSKEHSTTGHEGFTHFQQKLEAYVLREYDNPNDIMPLILKLVNPVPVYELTRPSTLLSVKELAADPIANLMLTEEWS